MTGEQIGATLVVGGLTLWVAFMIFIAGPDAIHSMPRLWHEWQTIFGWN
jgi:hypothetical protein